MELFEFDNYIFDLYGTLIDIHTDEYCDETWEKWIRFLDDKGIKHPSLSLFRDDFFNKDKEYRLRATEYEYPIGSSNSAKTLKLPDTTPVIMRYTNEYITGSLHLSCSCVQPSSRKYLEFFSMFF